MTKDRPRRRCLIRKIPQRSTPKSASVTAVSNDSTVPAVTTHVETRCANRERQVVNARGSEDAGAKIWARINAGAITPV